MMTKPSDAACHLAKTVEELDIICRTLGFVGAPASIRTAVGLAQVKLTSASKDLTSWAASMEGDPFEFDGGCEWNG